MSPHHMDRIKDEILDSFDEELELQLEDERLDELLGSGFATPFEVAVKAAARPFFDTASGALQRELAAA